MMFYTIRKVVQQETKIQRSVFIAALYPAASADEVRKLLLEHNKQYADATHNCYAYLLGTSQETSYYADAGEPAGTAGKPILNVLLRHELTNVLAVVTRYYGGIKLGVKGLNEAYSSAVEAACGEAELVRVRKMERYAVQCEYPLFELLKHRLAGLEADFVDVSYTDTVDFELLIPAEATDEALEILDGCQHQFRLIYYHKD